VKADQWFWSADGGLNGSGAMAHNCCAHGGEAEDALMMYLGDGAEGWTDYRVEVQLLVPTDREGMLQGLWVRGQYEERGKEDTAQWVTGYYVMLGGDRRVRLLQLQTEEDCQEQTCRTGKWLYAFNNPYTLRQERVQGLQLTRGEWHTLVVEVQGNRIKIWVDGLFAFEYVDDKSPFLQGTVGFKTYKAQPVLYDNLIVTPLD
jgi:hypothetical protein